MDKQIKFNFIKQIKCQLRIYNNTNNNNYNNLNKINHFLQSLKI